MKHAVLIIVGLTVLFTGTANALVTTTFDDVEAQVTLRLDNLPMDGLTKDQKKEKKSLEKVLKFFGKKSTFPKKDITRVKDIVKALVKQYPEDKEMALLLNRALGAFEDEVYAQIEDADFSFGYVGDENAKRDAAAEKREAAVELDMEFDALDDLVDMSKFVKNVDKGVANYAKATVGALKKETGLTDHEYAFLVKVKGGYQGAESCMKCHKKDGKQMLKAGHWLWEGVSANVEGYETEVHGKNDVINNFCIAVPSNEARCTQCHPGYGYRDQTFDFKDADALDCLICHDTTGTYKKDPKTAGEPVATVDLRNVALNVGNPSRQNCGACHFYAGGGDNVKKGDLGSSLLAPTREMDVHMGADGGNFSCQKCHVTMEHKIPGNQMQDNGQVDCQDCHDTTELSTANHTTTHLAALACQTCHIPTFSRQMPTKVDWDWSTAGSDDPEGDGIPSGQDEYGKEIYNKMKGSFVWEQNVKPALRWYNGKWDKTFIGVNDVHQGGVFTLSAPKGSEGDGKIYPFKLMTGMQPVDAAGDHRLLVPHLFPYNSTDTTAYWKGYDWGTALLAGSEAVGYTNYSRTFEFIETESFLSINHEVAPKAEALGAGGCSDCHTDNTRDFPWGDLISKPF